MRGTQAARWPSKGCRTDHPRVCGELVAALACMSMSAGSSPRVRGTLLIARADELRQRIIPACAGNSHDRGHGERRLADHPRVCGELPHCTRSPEPLSGSSPRVRGTRRHDWTGCRESRIIPACAGNSGWIVTRVRSRSDHPRVCGELSARRRRRSFSAGSSPRVRGTHWPWSVLHLDGRIIPACAGNSRLRPRHDPRAADHPRVCGELRIWRVTPRGASGSSPRVRGTLHPGPRKCQGPGIIPACAGNSC